MTTIAFKDGIMAADTKCSSNGHLVTYSQKILRIAGAVVGMAGEYETRSFQICLEEALGEGRLPTAKELIKTECDVRALVYMPADDRLYWMDCSWCGNKEAWVAEVVPLSLGVGAIGSGHAYAMGAMGAGASAKKAVQIACEYDIYSGGAVQEVGAETRARRGRKKR